MSDLDTPRAPALAITSAAAYVTSRNDRDAGSTEYDGQAAVGQCQVYLTLTTV